MSQIQCWLAAARRQAAGGKGKRAGKHVLPDTSNQNRFSPVGRQPQTHTHTHMGSERSYSEQQHNNNKNSEKQFDFKICRSLQHNYSAYFHQWHTHTHTHTFTHMHVCLTFRPTTCPTHSLILPAFIQLTLGPSVGNSNKQQQTIALYLACTYRFTYEPTYHI